MEKFDTHALQVLKQIGKYILSLNWAPPYASLACTKKCDAFALCVAKIVRHQQTLVSLLMLWSAPNRGNPHYGTMTRYITLCNALYLAIAHIFRPQNQELLMAPDTHPKFGYIRFCLPSQWRQRAYCLALGPPRLMENLNLRCNVGILRQLPYLREWRPFNAKHKQNEYDVWSLLLDAYYFVECNSMVPSPRISPQLLTGEVRIERPSGWGTRFGQHLNVVLSLCRTTCSSFMDQLHGLIEALFAHPCSTHSHPLQTRRLINVS